MKYSLNKRLLCLCLALEMLCAPLAMARVQDPAAASGRLALLDDEPLPETPLGEETLSAELTDPDGEDRPTSGHRPADTLADGEETYDYYGVALSYGQEITGTSAQPVLSRYGGHLQPEVGSVRSWGYQAIDQSKYMEPAADGSVTLTLPSSAALGRLPGLEPDGNWYLYPGVKGQEDWRSSGYDAETALKSWSFDETHPETYVKVISEDDPGVSKSATGRTITVTLTAAQLQEWAKTYGNTEKITYEDEWDPDTGKFFTLHMNYYYIPLVAGWKPSGNSSVTLFALDTVEEGTGAVTHVTDLFTTLFREATADDHLTAEQYGPKEYLIPDPQYTPDDAEYYTRRITTEFTEDNAFLPGPEDNEFYLRVDEEQESVTLRFQTGEPYYEYSVKGEGESPVSVSASFNGEPLDVSLVSLENEWKTNEEGVWKTDGQGMFPRSLPATGGAYVAQNLPSLPARGQWTVANIPLSKVSQADDPVGDPFTTVTVTVTAPNGGQSTYTFYIERLMTPHATLGFGNTPVGVISKDTTGHWGSDKEANKALAIENFKTTRSFGGLRDDKGQAMIPGGVYYRGEYSIKTWQGLTWNGQANYDIDADATAVVAYQDKAFSDPGVSFVDSEGRRVVFGDDAEADYQGCVTRTIALSTPAGDAPLTPDATGVACWYTVEDGAPALTTDASKASQTLHNADGSDVVDLRGLKVLPGVYTVTYTFRDPVLEGEPLSISRPLVVLPVPGDVDMDGAVTIADAQMIDANQSDWEKDATQPARLYHYRVMNIKQGDVTGATAIRNGFRPAVAELSRTDYFYPILPATAGAGSYVRKTWDTVQDGSSGATLRLKFLGVEKGTWYTQNGDTYTTNLSGPWAANKSAGVSIVPDPNASSGSGDVFWMGVYLEDAGALAGQSIEQLSLSLTYDSQYLRPARVHGFQAADGISGDENKWRQLTLIGYNFLEGSKENGVAMTTFSGMTGSDYDYSYSTPARSYEQNPHYSKVIGDLEQDYTDQFGQLSINYLKEVVFSLQGKSSSINRATLQSGKYLLVLPFQLIKHPAADRMNGTEGDNELAQLIELSAGMRDFTLITRSTGRALPGASASRIAWMASLMDVPAGLSAAAGGQTYAFSAQNTIYGGETRNLRDILTYESREQSADTGLIPIGEDKTERIEPEGEVEYDKPFKYTSSYLIEGTVTEGALPPGLTLNGSLGTISGTPTKAGTYDFTIKGLPYRMTVKQKTIHYMADTQGSYYGQGEFRGNSSTDFTFKFTLADLAQRDREKITDLADGAAQGTGSQLEAALGWETGTTYTAPTFRAMAAGNAVKENTDVGRYPIQVYGYPDATNYTFEYVGNSTNCFLQIHRRPVWITRLEIPQNRSGASIYNDQTGAGMNLSLQEETGETFVYLTTRPETHPEVAASGQYQGRPLSDVGRVEGDRLALTFVANFLQNEKDEEYQTSTGADKITYPFYLEHGSEARNLGQVSGLNMADTRLSDLLDSPNYNLQLTTNVLDDARNNIVGTVVRRGVQAIDFDSYPAFLTWENGKPVSTAYYGSLVNDHYRLRVTVTRGGADDSMDDTVVGSYQYNAPDLLPMDIHYNWVTEDERNEGLKDPNCLRPCVEVTGWDIHETDPTKADKRPYNATTVLDPTMDGYYLCAAVKKYEKAVGDEGEHITYIKVYSGHPIQVKKQPLNLTVPTRQGRYYGERNSFTNYTYNYNNLVAADRTWVENYVEEYNRDKPLPEQITKNSQTALKALFDEKYAGDAEYNAPELVVSTVKGVPKDEEKANEYTPVTQACFLVLHGGASGYYDFSYGADNGSEFGAEQYIIDRRPIVVSDVYSNDQNIGVIAGETPAEGLHKTHFDAIYADSKNLYLKNNTAQPDHVAFTLPAQDDNGTYYYYSDVGSGAKIEIPAERAFQSTQAVLTEDKEKLEVNYSIRFIPDPGHGSWRTFTNNYYSVEDLNGQHDDSGHKGTAQKPVEICDLALSGDSITANNYLLVYRTLEGSVRKSPSNVTQAAYPDPNNNGQLRPYQVHGTGTVTLRPIKDLTFDSVSRNEYTYGDPYAPQQKNPTTQKEMVVRVNYDTTLDKNHNEMHNAYESETISFTLVRLTETETTSTFAQRGFTIYYQMPGQTQEDARAAGQVIDFDDPMLPGVHDGASLFVVGQRRISDKPIVSDSSRTKLIVTQRVLHLRAPDTHKFYGEANPTPEGGYTFPMSDLAQRDREKLAKLKGVAVSALPTTGKQADLELLSAEAGWDFGSAAPKYTTAATPTTGVGAYPFTMTMEGRFKNYKTECTSGQLHIYPRPVTVMGVTSGESDPVYTIYNQSSTSTFKTQLDTSRVVLKNSAQASSGALTEWTVTGADGILHSLPLTGSALVGSDNLTFNVELYFYNDSASGFTWDLGGGVTDEIQPYVNAKFQGLTQSGATANYTVSNAGSYNVDGLWGQVKLRTIDHIVITDAPKMTGYTYGDTLDLSGLTVEVLYKKAVGETDADNATVRYIGPEQFRSYGLYVNYWDPTKDAPTTDTERHALPNKYRRADTGDHITIAPTHDTRNTAEPFAANGKTLIVSAFQDSTDMGTQPAAEPQILRGKDQSTGNYTYGDPQRLQIAPLPLQYSLSAADKTYDGTAKAAGTLVLHNIFDRSAQVQVVQHTVNGVTTITSDTEKITDDVYVPMGAAATPRVVDGTMTFTTGTYDGAHQAASLLNPNAAIAWTQGYTWGNGLTFTFANPNVHYLEQGETAPRGIGTEELAAYWRAAQDKNTVTTVWDFYRDVSAMPVEVTGMVLEGPDAANYTWNADKSSGSSTEVTMTTRAQAVSGQAAAPYATIHKANRTVTVQAAKLPQLLVDDHTNVIKLAFDRALLSAQTDNNNAADAADAFRDELHFEYALFYQKDGVFAQWAGRDGQSGYQDTTFFGGEFIAPQMDPGYIPDLERLPKPETAGDNTVYKGQLYRWASEDTGLSDKGYREDSGVTQNAAAYPGGAEAASYYWNYSLFTTDRVNLPRDTTFYPLVRLAETHNYNPSGDLSGHEDVTQALLNNVHTAATEAELQTASGAVFAAAQPMTQAARDVSEARKSQDRDTAESGRWPEAAPEIAAASAAKTFRQRLDLLSVSKERNVGTGDNTEYIIKMLESVWFTDTLTYPEAKHLDAVVYNHPTRYYGYYWDPDLSAALDFRDKDVPIDLTDVIHGVKVRRQQAGGGSAEELVDVNLFDDSVGGYVAELYVQTTTGGGNLVRTIRIVPKALYVRLGDPPYALGVVTTPPKPSNRRYKWSSSDESVATVDENGVVTFRGEGEATITVTTDNNRSASILVVVSAVLPVPNGENSLFRFDYAGPWEVLDENGAFRPHEQMTRAQLTVLLDIFLNLDAQWKATAELAYVDITGKERYYGALSRLTGAGVVKGVPGQAFLGGQLVTRAEFAAMLCRMLGLETPDTAGQEHIFEDSGEADTWAYAYIDALAKTGVMRGVGGGNFAPNRVLTREESAVVIARLLVTQLSSGQTNLNIPTDMTPANWSYEAVLRAVNSIAFPD